MRHKTLSASKRDKIKELNDRFRTNLSVSLGQVCYTSGIENLPLEKKSEVLEAVRSFKRFDENNDPWGEHDFGIVTIGGTKCYWKIDYYDRGMQYGSGGASNPRTTWRVLTIMLAEEY